MAYHIKPPLHLLDDYESVPLETTYPASVLNGVDSGHLKTSCLLSENHTLSDNQSPMFYHTVMCSTEEPIHSANLTHAEYPYSNEINNNYFSHSMYQPESHHHFASTFHVPNNSHLTESPLLPDKPLPVFQHDPSNLHKRNSAFSSCSHVTRSQDEIQQRDDSGHMHPLFKYASVNQDICTTRPRNILFKVRSMWLESIPLGRLRDIAQFILNKHGNQMPYDRHYWSIVYKSNGLNHTNKEIQLHLMKGVETLQRFVSQIYNAGNILRDFILDHHNLKHIPGDLTDDYLKQWLSGTNTCLIRQLMKHDSAANDIELSTCLNSTNLLYALQHGGIFIKLPAHSQKNFKYFNLLAPGRGDTRHTELPMTDGGPDIDVKKSRTHLSFPFNYFSNKLRLPKICVFQIEAKIELLLFYKGNRQKRPFKEIVLNEVTSFTKNNHTMTTHLTTPILNESSQIQNNYEESFVLRQSPIMAEKKTNNLHLLPHKKKIYYTPSHSTWSHAARSTLETDPLMDLSPYDYSNNIISEKKVNLNDIYCKNVFMQYPQINKECVVYCSIDVNDSDCVKKSLNNSHFINDKTIQGPTVIGTGKGIILPSRVKKDLNEKGEKLLLMETNKGELIIYSVKHIPELNGHGYLVNQTNDSEKDLLENNLFFFNKDYPIKHQMIDKDTLSSNHLSSCLSDQQTSLEYNPFHLTTESSQLCTVVLPSLQNKNSSTYRLQHQLNSLTSELNISQEQEEEAKMFGLSLTNLNSLNPMGQDVPSQCHSEPRVTHITKQLYIKNNKCLEHSVEPILNEDTSLTELTDHIFPLLSPNHTPTSLCSNKDIQSLHTIGNYNSLLYNNDTTCNYSGLNERPPKRLCIR